MDDPDREPAPEEAESASSEREPTNVDAPTSPWAEVLADATDIASEYREDGWTVEVVEPRDVAPWTGDGPHGGFVVLVDDDSFGALEPLVEAGTFGAAEVYRRSIGAATVVVLVELDAPTERAIVLPLYYRPDEADQALAAARTADELQVRLRPDGSDDWLTFVHDDPTLFGSDGT